MTRILPSVCLCAIACLFTTGCFNRYQNPYGYNNACITPPGTGGYAVQNPNPYYQYQTQQPVGYGQPAAYPQPYNGAQTWQASAANFNGASAIPVIESGMEVSPANFEAETVVPVQPQQQQPTPVQIEPQTNFNESGYRENTQSYPQAQYQPIGYEARTPQSVLVPLTSQQNYVQNVAVAAPVRQQPVMQQPIYYVPVDPGAIVMPQSYQPQYQYGPAYQPPVNYGATSGTNVAYGSTLTSHNPQWQGVR